MRGISWKHCFYTQFACKRETKDKKDSIYFIFFLLLLLNPFNRYDKYLFTTMRRNEKLNLKIKNNCLSP